MKEKMGVLLSVVAVTGFLFGQVATSGVASAEEQGKKQVVLPEGVYLVKKDDTLWALAGRFLDNPRLWREIWEQNPFIPNPDLIFPGDPLIIPGLTGPPKAVAEAPPVPEEWVTPPPAPGPEVELPLEEEPIPTEEELRLAEEEALRVAGVEEAGGAIRVPRHERTLIIPRGELECTGYVAEKKEIHTVGRIIRSVEELDDRVSFWNEVFVDLGGQQVQKGDRFKIIRETRKVIHPVTGSSVGIKVRTLGTLEIVDTRGRAPRARIVYSCEDIAPGDGLTRVTPLEVPPVGMSRPTNLQRAGFIVASKSDADSLGQGDIVYVDVGQAEQIVPGDEFAIYQKTGRRTSLAQIERGELVVVRTTANAAAALVTRSDLRLVGDERIVLVRKMP